MPHVDAGSWHCALRYCVIVINSEDADLKAQASELLTVCVLADRSCITPTIARMPLLDSLATHLSAQQPPALVNASCQLLAALTGVYSSNDAAFTSFLAGPAVSNIVQRFTRQESTRDAAMDAVLALARYDASSDDCRVDLLQSDVNWYLEALRAEGVAALTSTKLLALIPILSKSRQLIDRLMAMVRGGLVPMVSACVRRGDSALLLQSILTLNVILTILGYLLNSSLPEVAASLVSDGTVAEAFAQVERSHSSSEAFLDFVERISRERGAQPAFKSTNFPHRLDSYLSVIKSGPTQHLSTCLGIAYNILVGDPDLESYVRDSSMLDTCIEIACSNVAATSTKSRAWRVLSLALPLRAFRSRSMDASLVDGLVKSSLLLMAREANISDQGVQGVLFTSVAYLIFHVIMLRYNNQDISPPSEFVIALIGSDSFLTRCTSGLVEPSSSRPFLFALHSLACFPDASVQAMLHARLRDSSLFQKLCDICSSSPRDDVLEMALLALGSLIGCNAYFPHLAAQVAERVEVRKRELSEEERVEMVLAEHAAVRDRSDRVRNVPLASMTDAARRAVDKANLCQLLQGTRGLQSSIALLRLLATLCEDRDYARKLVSPTASSRQHILGFASIITTLVNDYCLFLCKNHRVMLRTRSRKWCV